jgi:TPR repeat protein
MIIVELWSPLRDCYAQYAMAERYSDGSDGVTADSEQARILWDAALPQLRQLADDGDARAQYPISLVYQAEGLDMEQGMIWWHQAAAAGHALAQNDLGDRLVCGVGGDTTDDCDEMLGLQWYQAAAAQGLAIAYHNLADCYRNGTLIAYSSIIATDYIGCNVVCDRLGYTNRYRSRAEVLR